MHKKVYFQNKPLFLCDSVSRELEDYLHRPDAVFMDEFSPAAIRTMIYEMEQPEIHAGIFLHSDLDRLLNAFKKQLEVIIAGGGFVYTDAREALLIHRRGKWDLPKGKLDEGEEISACALREVQEETGLKEVKLGEPLCITYHTYHQDGKHILKESHWFLMEAKKEPLTPQEDEDITEARWVPLSELPPFMGQTHGSILDVVQAGISRVQEAKGS